MGFWNPGRLKEGGDRVVRGILRQRQAHENSATVLLGNCGGRVLQRILVETFALRVG